MKSKHILFSAILSLWGLCFLGATQTNMQNILPLFNTSWTDAMMALLIAIPLHAAVFGLASLSWYSVLHWRQQDV